MAEETISNTSKFTIEDLDSCWDDYPKERLIDILNGEYSVEDARVDLLSLIGSKYDKRIKLSSK